MKGGSLFLETYLHIDVGDTSVCEVRAASVGDIPETNVASHSIMLSRHVAKAMPMIMIKRRFILVTFRQGRVDCNTSTVPNHGDWILT